MRSKQRVKPLRKSKPHRAGRMRVTSPGSRAPAEDGVVEARFQGPAQAFGVTKMRTGRGGTL
jgi:hypothetical protein